MFKVGGIQMRCVKEKSKNLEKAINLAKLAVERGAKIICFPELFSTSWFPWQKDESSFSYAEAIPGETIQLMQRVAKEWGVMLICPIYEKGTDALGYNTAVIIDEQGEILGKYRKNHIPQLELYEEKFYFQPGNLGFPVWETKYGKLGIQICWDNFFPEGTRILALKGAELIFAPTACSFLPSAYKWKSAITANALVNSLFIFRVNRTGEESRISFYGKSFCVDPHGETIVDSSDDSEGIVIADIDFAQVTMARMDWPFFQDRRAEIYRELL